MWGQESESGESCCRVLLWEMFWPLLTFSSDRANCIVTDFSGRQRGGCGSPITDDVWRIMVTIANQCPWRPPTPPHTGHNQQPGKVRRREDWNWNWVSLTRIYLQHAQKGQNWCWFTSVYNFLHSSSIFSHKYWSNLQHFPIPVQCSIVSLLESRSALRLFARDNIIVCCLLFSVSPSISAFHVNI